MRVHKSGYLIFWTLLFSLTFKTGGIYAKNIYSHYPDLAKSDYIFLIDQDSKEILLEKNADVKIAPSSMTKLMTAYVVFEKVKQGKVSLKNQCLIGEEAWRKKGSTMFLNYGDIVTIDQLLTGLLVVSGNDAAIALSEIIAGNPDDFVDLMNDAAKKIGLKNSQFRNPHGLNEEGHYMSLRDLANLSISIANDFPEYMHYFSTAKFTYQEITQSNRNPLISKGYEGVTGMKTGYTSKGGYGITASAIRDGRKLIAITNEAKTPKHRAKIITQALDYGFNDHKKVALFNKNHIVTKAKVWLGQKDHLEIAANKDVFVTLPNDKSVDDLNIKIEYKEEPIYAPVPRKKEVAKLVIELSGKNIRELSLFAKENIDKAGFFMRIWGRIKYRSYIAYNKAVSML